MMLDKRLMCILAGVNLIHMLHFILNSNFHTSTRSVIEKMINLVLDMTSLI